MAEFFEQICEVLAKTGKKHPGQLAHSEDIQNFFNELSKPAHQAQTAADSPVTQAAAAASRPPARNIPQPPVQLPVPAPSAAADAPGNCHDLTSLAAALGNCRRCPLASNRHNIVFGEGNPDARLMFVGEAPGYDEDMQGRPFVGKAGQLLDKMINAMQFTRQEVYIANIVKCRPHDNRTPMPDEIDCCIGFLHRQIELIRPEVIVALGATAAKALLKTTNGITNLRGRWCSYENIPVMPTFHPAFLLRQESAKREAWQDLQLVMARFGKVHRR